MILQVTRLVVKEERSRAHSLNFIWDSIVDSAILQESNRRKEVLFDVVSNGAYLGYHYLKEFYFYDRFHEVFGRKSNPNLHHGALTGLEARAFEATSASNVVLNGDGAGIFARSSYVTIDKGTRIVNSITEWGDGGGVQCMSSKLDIITSTLKYNAALQGGGVYSKDCDVHVSDSTAFEENLAYRDGGAMFLGVSTRAKLVDAQFKGNAVECPTKSYGQTVCPEWQNSVVGVQGALDAFCIHPSCKSYMGSGGAVYVAEAGSVLLRRTDMALNTATRGGGMFVLDTLRLEILENSSFTNNSCRRPFALVNSPTFTAGGGALYFDLTQYVQLDERPLISATRFWDNKVLEGSGGAIFWKVAHTMIPVAKAAGGMLAFGANYDAMNPGDTGEPLARGNAAAWGGNFIQSSAMDLVVLEGPSRNPGAFVPMQESCAAAACPFHCSGADAVKGQQCISRNTSTTTLAEPGTITSGLPLEDAVGVEKLRVVVLDYYNNIVESASEVVFVEAAVDMPRAGLGMAFPKDFFVSGSSHLSNCSAAGYSGNIKRPKQCSYKLSPETVAVGAVEGNGASQMAVMPVRGIASFDRLALHADPSDRCFTA